MFKLLTVMFPDVDEIGVFKFRNFTEVGVASIDRSAITCNEIARAGVEEHGVAGTDMVAASLQTRLECDSRLVNTVQASVRVTLWCGVGMQPFVCV